ncbi:MAG: hypothetical protein K0M50_03015 [Prolixibacteraceae bacterium]|nr:hypothetical protein [Prolixibacteraceae bacterium]
MKQTLFIFILIIAFVFQGAARNLKSDTIRIQKVFGGYNFIQNGEKLSVKQLVLVTKTYEPAYSLMKSSQKLYSTGVITACVGGFIIGSQVGRSIDGQSPRWEIVALGSGIALASIPLQNILSKKLYVQLVCITPPLNKVLPDKSTIENSALALREV